MGRKDRPARYCWTLWARVTRPGLTPWVLMKITDKEGCQREEVRIQRRHIADKDIETLILPPDEDPAIIPDSKDGIWRGQK